MAHWTDDLVKLGACAEAIEYGESFASAQEAWGACERGDWMLWWYGRVAGPPGDDSRRPLVLAACECARLALPRWESKYPDDRRPRAAIETAERWARGEAGVTLDQVHAAAAAAAAAAYAAAYAADYAAAAAAAAAAADAAAAYVAADAGGDADAERRLIRQQCADIVRKHYPSPPTN